MGDNRLSKTPTTEYLVIWQAQAKRERKRNPGAHAQVDLDTWIAILTELLKGRTTNARRSNK